MPWDADGDAGRNITVITVLHGSNRLLHLDKQKSVLLSPSSAPSSLSSWTHRASIAVAGKRGWVSAEDIICSPDYWAPHLRWMLFGEHSYGTQSVPDLDVYPHTSSPRFFVIFLLILLLFLKSFRQIVSNNPWVSINASTSGHLSFQTKWVSTCTTQVLPTGRIFPESCFWGFLGSSVVENLPSM